MSSNIPNPTHRAWGRHVSEYFFRDPTNSLFPRERPATSIVDVKLVAIPLLQTAGFAEPGLRERGALEDVLSLLHHPATLRNLDNTMLLARCMQMLRRFTGDGERDGHALFSYEFGWLCFRVVVLLIQVGILVHTQKFDAFVRRARNLSDPIQISATLSKIVAEIFQDAGGDRNAIFGILTSQRGGRMFLRTVGGFYDTDVSFFLSVLWQDRKTFLKICSQISTPGWVFALLTVGEHMQWALELGIENVEEWGHLQTLCFRYLLTIPHSEEGALLEHICFEADAYRLGNNEESYIVSFVDMADARTAMEDYIKRISSCGTVERFHSGTMQLVVGFITQDVMLDLPDLVPNFIKATSRWLLEHLDSYKDARVLSEDQDMVKCAVYVLRFIRLSYYHLRNANGRDISTLTRALSESDFINLVGRLLLVPAGIGSAIHDQPSRVDSPSSDDTIIESEWNHLVEEAIRFGTTYGNIAKGSNGVLSGYYPDWLKTWRCFQAQFPHHKTQSQWFKDYLKGCDIAWSNLGKALGYVDRELRVQGYYTCAYPRCQGPVSIVWADFACNGCFSVTYCSSRCQNLHWIAPYDSHREQCSRVMSEDILKSKPLEV